MFSSTCTCRGSFSVKIVVLTWHCTTKFHAGGKPCRTPGAYSACYRMYISWMVVFTPAVEFIYLKHSFLCALLNLIRQMTTKKNCNWPSSVLLYSVVNKVLPQQWGYLPLLLFFSLCLCMLCVCVYTCLCMCKGSWFISTLYTCLSSRLHITM